MTLKTKRWNDRRKRDDGWRILICCYRPRAVPKEKETWDNWYPELGPSKKLHAAYYGKQETPITWDEYRRLYLVEMKEQEQMIEEFADLVAEGKTITLLCSSACTKEAQCHRTLLRELIEEKVRARPAAPQEAAAH